jgi:hypothetical protein
MIGGIIVASLLVLIVQGSLISLFTQTSRQGVVQDFSKLNSNIDSICRMSPKSKENMEMQMPNVEAVFAAENDSRAPPESRFLITQSNTSRGQSVCLSFEDTHHGCVQHSCPVNMTWMGTPREGSDAYILGEESGFNYKIAISKKLNGVVGVEGRIAP